MGSFFGSCTRVFGLGAALAHLGCQTGASMALSFSSLAKDFSIMQGLFLAVLGALAAILNLLFCSALF